MALTITFSTEEDGASLGSILDLGEGGYNGDWPDPVEFWIRHDGAQAINNCRLYIQPYSGTYIGEEDAQTDFDDVSAASTVIGHIEYSLDDGDSWHQFTVGTGVSLTNAINIGSIAAEASVQILLKFIFNLEIPEENALGLRQFDLRFTYTFTD